VIYKVEYIINLDEQLHQPPTTNDPSFNIFRIIHYYSGFPSVVGPSVVDPSVGDPSGRLGLPAKSEKLFDSSDSNMFGALRSGGAGGRSES
jgi:hypothetical protein